MYTADTPATDRELALIIYPNGNSIAYHALRKRLMQSLNRFIALKMIDHDSSDTSKALSLVNMARYLYAHDLQKIGWKYLKKAARLALKNELFEILNSIYVLQIQYFNGSNAERSELVRLWRENKERLEKTELGEIALSLISHRIMDARENGQFGDIDQLIRHVLDELQLSADYLLQPRFVYHVAAVNRKKMLAEKDYFNLEPFLVKQYNAILEKNGFQKKHSYYQLGFLYMISHILYRNKKFLASQKYLHLLEAELDDAPKIQVAEFGQKAQLLKANLYFFIGQADKAVTLLKSIIESPQIPFSNRSKLNAIVNLGIAQFFIGQYDEAHKTLRLIAHSDQWCEKIMGTEWVFKKAIMEAILYTQLDELSLVQSRIRHIHYSFKHLFKLPKYARVSAFIKLLEKLAATDGLDQLEKLSTELEGAFDWIPMEYEDLQAVTFYAWLKAKILRRDPYTELLLLVGEAEFSISYSN